MDKAKQSNSASKKRDSKQPAKAQVEEEEKVRESDSSNIAQKNQSAPVKQMTSDLNIASKEYKFVPGKSQDMNALAPRNLTEALEGSAQNQTEGKETPEQPKKKKSKRSGKHRKKNNQNNFMLDYQNEALFPL